MVVLKHESRSQRSRIFSHFDLQRRRKLEAERLAIEEEMRLTAQMGRGAAKREAERRLQVQISYSTFIIISLYVIAHSFVIL